ncbi:LysR family transcriptional regulator [Trinickia sp.]|uniref:LysR family transcriptional regulator n=1 Tax=Trinickia sp. TaxID=2571163 RepID=UPI003F7D86D6
MPAANNQQIRRNLQGLLDNRVMPLARLSLRQLEAFVTVADHHSFSAAGDRLGLTAQAVSQLVAELETTLGFRLFDRTTRRVSLSAAGRDYLPSAQTVLRHAQAAEKAADDVRNRAAGLVRIGAPLVLASTALPEAMPSARSNAILRACEPPCAACSGAERINDRDRPRAHSPVA